MRKISPEYENPIDNINLFFAEFLCPTFKKIGFTPNGITTLSLVFGMLSVHALYTGKLYKFGILYYISYFFDCLDGHYARKYDMITKFGDAYDHVKDFVVTVSIIAVFILRNRDIPRDKMIGVIAIILLAHVCMNSHLGCQEKIYNKEESGTLSHLKYLCPGTREDAMNNIKFTRYFGCATINILMILIIIYVEKTK
jgi:phosphatidylglycerophosphate synthase